jgi:hypothetical protein
MMGIYGGELLVEVMPITLPKLCIVTFCESPASEKIKSLSVKVLQGEQVVHEQAIPTEELAVMQENLKTRDMLSEPLERISIGFNTTLSPFVIESPSILKVIMTMDDKEYSAGKLRLKIVDQPTQPT